MNESSLLHIAADHFVSRYHAASKLRAEQSDWDCCLRLHANDASATVSIVVRRGCAETVVGESPAEPDLVITASLSVLLDILELRLNPNQPYLFGELTLVGHEADFMRVDYIASRLCCNA
jgi:putative sterol carrier protein